MFVLMFAPPKFIPWHELDRYAVVWFGSGAFIGAGVLLPFKHPVAGFLLGVLLMFGLAVLLAVTAQVYE